MRWRQAATMGSAFRDEGSRRRQPRRRNQASGPTRRARNKRPGGYAQKSLAAIARRRCDRISRLWIALNGRDGGHACDPLGPGRGDAHVHYYPVREAQGMRSIRRLFKMSRGPEAGRRPGRRHARVSGGCSWRGDRGGACSRSRGKRQRMGILDVHKPATRGRGRGTTLVLRAAHPRGLRHGHRHAGRSPDG